MTTIKDVLEMSEPELCRRGSVTKQLLVQALMEAKKHMHPIQNPNQPQEIVTALEELLEKKLDPVISQFSSLVQKVSDLADQVNDLQMKSDKFAKSQDEMLEDTLWEAEQRLKRRKFVIVSGLSEQSSGSIDERRNADVQAIQALASTIGLQSFYPKEVTRIGRIEASRPRLLRFKCSNTEERVTLLKKSRDLRNSVDFKNVYLNPDQTKIQREKSRLLRLQLKERRNAGEDVFIKQGKIITSSSATQNFQ